MPRRRGRRAILSRSVVSAPPMITTGSPAEVERAIGQVSEAVNRLASTSPSFIDADLVVGDNAIDHQLGRPAIGVHVVPMAPSAAFAWGFDPAQLGNSQPHLVAVIPVVGTGLRVRLFFF